MQTLGNNREEVSFWFSASETETKPHFLRKARRWVEMHATPSLAAQTLQWGALRGEVRERVELLKAPQAAWWGVVGGGANGKCRIAETGNFPYSPAFFHATTPFPPTSSSPVLSLHLSAMVCIRQSKLVLRSEKGSAAKLLCWH